jgi:hypothetical protein
VNNSNNPPINETNLDKYDDSLIALATAHNELGTKKVRAATTGNITLSGTQTVDGVALSTGQRCFVRAQTTAAQNGIYVVAAGAWTRAVDADTEAKFAGGALIQVERGTVNGGKMFRCTNTGAVTLNTTALTFEEVGAGGGTGTPGVYTTDGTTPLKYSAFLQAASGNQTAALQNAVNALFASAAYNKSLDLEGALISISSPITIPTTGTGGSKSIMNGEIQAADGFTGGDHMIKALNVNMSYFMRLINVTMNGRELASWIWWDAGNYIIIGCQFKNNKGGTAGQSGWGSTMYNRAGLFVSESGSSSGDAGFWITNCWFSCDDNQILPTQRTRIAIVSQTGDNKISGGTTMSYFCHSLVSEGPGMIIDNFHPFQGVTGGGVQSDMTEHTAVVKFTNGRCGAQVNGLYLGKGFMEISNESNCVQVGKSTTQEEIGEIVISNMRAFMQSAEAGAAHIVVRNYDTTLSQVSPICKATDISIMNSYFLNGGTVQTLPTKLHNPAYFDRSRHSGIYMKGNTFDRKPDFTTYEVAPQSNPCTRRVALSGTSHTIDMSGFMPFGGFPQSVLSFMMKNSGGTHVFRDTTPGNTNNATLSSSASYTGDALVTVTCNENRPGSFVE